MSTCFRTASTHLLAGPVIHKALDPSPFANYVMVGHFPESSSQSYEWRVLHSCGLG